MNEESKGPQAKQHKNVVMKRGLASEESKVWTCKSFDVESLTVGQKFFLKCADSAADAPTAGGTEPAADSSAHADSSASEESTASGPTTPASPDVDSSWVREDLKLVIDAKPGTAELYRLRLLEVSSLGNNHADLVVTSYLVGENSLKGIRLTDGKREVSLSGLKWNVSSVIVAKEGEEPQPFGPIGPLKLSYSWALIAPILLLLLLVTLFGLRWGRMEAQRRKLLNDMKKFQTGRPPVDELFKDLRALDRKFDFSKSQKLECVKNLDHAFRLYLVREFVVPAFQWGPNDLLREVKKKNHAVYEKTADSLKRTLIELGQAARRTGDFSPQDIKQLAYLVRKTAEGMAGEKRRGPRQVG